MARNSKYSIGTEHLQKYMKKYKKEKRKKEKRKKEKTQIKRGKTIKTKKKEKEKPFLFGKNQILKKRHDIFGRICPISIPICIRTNNGSNI